MNQSDQQLPTYLVRPVLDKVEQVGRTLLKMSPHYSIDRKEGVTALVLLFNEPLAFQAVETILPYVDEVVVVDASDNIPQLPQSEKIQYIRTPAEQNMQVKIGLLLSKYRWILRWDGDFTPSYDIVEFLQMTKLKPDGYWQIKGMVKNIDHQNHPVLVQKESYLFTYHPAILTADFTWLKKTSDMVALFRGGLPGRICYGTLPPFFGMVDTSLVYANHFFEAKSTQRLIEREYQAHWSLLSDRQRAEYHSFVEFVQEHVVIE